MSIETAMRSLLTADATVASLVIARVYPQVAPQGATLPFIVYTQTGESKLRSLRRTVNLFTFQARIDCYAATYAEAVALADAARDVLAGYQGSLNSGAILVQSCWVDDANDEIDQPIDGDQNPTHNKALDVRISYKEGS